MWASSLTRTFLLTTLSSATRTLRASLLCRASLPRPSLLHLAALAAAVACSGFPEGVPDSDCPALAAKLAGAMEFADSSATGWGGELPQRSLEGGLKQAEAALQQSMASMEALPVAGIPTTESSEVPPRTSCTCPAQARPHWHACRAAAALQPGLASSSEALLLQGSRSLQTIAATDSREV